MREVKIELDRYEYIHSILPLENSFIILTVNHTPGQSYNGVHGKLLQCNSTGELTVFDHKSNCQFINVIPGIETGSGQQFFKCERWESGLPTSGHKEEFWWIDEDKITLFETKQNHQFIYFHNQMMWTRSKNYIAGNLKQTEPVFMTLPFNISNSIHNNKNANLYLIEFNSMKLDSYEIPMKPELLAISRNEMTIMISNKKQILIMDL